MANDKPKGNDKVPHDFRIPDGVDPKLPYRVTDPETGKAKVYLGKVGFNMGTRRAGEPRMDPKDREKAIAQQLKVNLKG